MNLLDAVNVALSLVILFLVVLKWRAAATDLSPPPAPGAASNAPEEPSKPRPRVSVIDDQRAWINERKEAEARRNELVP